MGPKTAVRGLGRDQKPSRSSVAEINGVVSVTEPIMVYVAILVSTSR
jgi:hypothetical protein